MKNLAIIGGNGLLGSDLVRYLGIKFRVTSISRENYTIYVGNFFDVIINANGNSKRFWANNNPQDDYLASTDSVRRSVFDFPCDVYIYISSPDTYQNHTESRYTKEDGKNDPIQLETYGFHKYLAELIVKKYKKKFVILRSAMILGSNLRKGPLYDIINNKVLFITLSSKLQFITTHAIAEIIERLLKSSVINETINIGGKGSFGFKKIQKYFDKSIRSAPFAKPQVYEMNVKKLQRWYPKLKTSEEYLREFLGYYEKKRLRT